MSKISSFGGNKYKGKRVVANSKITHVNTTQNMPKNRNQSSPTTLQIHSNHKENATDKGTIKLPKLFL